MLKIVCRRGELDCVISSDPDEVSKYVEVPRFLRPLADLGLVLKTRVNAKALK